MRGIRGGGLLAAAAIAIAAGLGSLSSPLAAQAPRDPAPSSGSGGGAGPAPGEGAEAVPGAVAGLAGRLAVGDTVTGELAPGDREMEDGTLADVWAFDGMAGQTVRIDLRSDEFDTYLQLLDAAGRELAEDDDSGGDLNSRLTFTLPATGTYQVVVNSAGHEKKAGVYTLSIR